MPKHREVPGIHIQWPWSQLILSGEKKVETRSYPLPKKYIGKTLAIIETPGPRGKSAAGIVKSRIIGVVEFSEAFRYQTKAQWQKDRERHLVDHSDPQFAFSTTKPKWGWVVSKVRPLAKPMPPPKKRGIVFASACQI